MRRWRRAEGGEEAREDHALEPVLQTTVGDVKPVEAAHDRESAAENQAIIDGLTSLFGAFPDHPDHNDPDF